MGDIAQTQPVRRNDKVANVIYRHELSPRAYAQTLIAGGKPPCVNREIASREQVAEIGNIDAVSRYHVGIEEDSYFTRVHAMQFDAGYPVDALETSFQEPVEQVVTVGQVTIARDAQLQDRLVAQ